MQRIRIQRKGQTLRHDPSPVLPLDPRDPDIVRAKEAARRGAASVHQSSAGR